MSNETESYTITSELLGDGGEATFEQIADMVKEWQYEGWDLETEEYTLSDEVRVYAYPVNDDNNDDADYTPSRHTAWVKEESFCYLVVAEKKSIWG